MFFEKGKFALEKEKRGGKEKLFLFLNLFSNNTLESVSVLLMKGKKNFSANYVFFFKPLFLNVVI